MKKLVSISIALLLSANCFAGNSTEVDSAISWLEVVDSGSYEESWQQAAPFFKNHLSSQEWEQALNQARSPLGKALSRTVVSASPYTSLPGAPDGEYIVIVLSTRFEQMDSATETITVSKVGNEWRTVGYFIK